MWSFGVPNAPCGVERLIHYADHLGVRMFLMHRVELKESLNPQPSCFWDVPNAPCGVESLAPALPLYGGGGVPNAPCGVERFQKTSGSLFIAGRFKPIMQDADRGRRKRFKLLKTV
jgi:hypothetical protein